MLTPCKKKTTTNHHPCHGPWHAPNIRTTLTPIIAIIFTTSVPGTSVTLLLAMKFADVNPKQGLCYAVGLQLCHVPRIHCDANVLTHDGSMVLPYMVCHGSH
jgi:hypothetical protein